MSGDTSLLGLIFGTLVCSRMFDCNQDFDSYGGIALWLVLMVYMFKQLGTICDEYFVPALEVIVERLDMSNDVAGATFMAAGSSAPELFTSLVATFLIVNEGGVGTIVGSAIFNVLVIIGLTGYVACKESSLAIWWYPLTRDAFFYAVSVGELVLVLADEEVKWYEGVIMLCTYVLYCGYMKVNHRVVKLLGIKVPDARQDAEVVDVTSWEDPVTEVVPIPPRGMGSTASLSGTLSATLAGGRRGEGGEASEKLSSKKPVAGGGDVTTCSIDESHEVPMQTLPSRNSDGAVLPPHLPHFEGKMAWEQQLTALDPPAIPTPSNGTSSRASDAVRSHAMVKWSSKELSRELRKKHHGHSPAGGLGSRSFSFGYVNTPVLPVLPEAVSDQKPPESVAQAMAPRAGPSVISIRSADEDEPQDCRSKYCRDPLCVLMELLLPSPEKHCWLLFVLTIILIGAATYVMVDATNRIGIILKVPPLVMGLIFLAAGTSIPDALGSIAVARQGEGDMAVANALGSNVFDILIGLGVPWTIRCAMGKKVEFHDQFDTLVWDIVILAGVCLLFVGALVVNRWHLTRGVGLALLFLYLLYVVYNVLAVWVFETKDADE